jgi:hypothetical protein
VEPEPSPEGTTAQIWPEPEQVVAELPTEPTPIAAEVEPQPEPVAAETVDATPQAAEMPRIAPISETIVRLPQRPSQPAPAPERLAAADDSPGMAARRAQLDDLGLGDGSDIPEQAPAVLPYRSRGAAITPAELAARAAGATFWEASAREVAGAVGNVGLQNCGHCGLALSANARFCRRCGTQQARSA